VNGRWTVKTLKKHYDAILQEKDLRYQQRFEAGEKRLDAMNEFRAALSDAQKTFVTWPVLMAIILAASTITGTIVLVATFFIRK
jgi:membrane protein required for beta-lactamase induction